MTNQANGELRVAVVLYGGVSLAVYMSAVCEELLRLVRGTADAPGALDEVETIYRELSHRTRPAGGRSRVLVDIITGSSAGGINGVALAKALTVGAPHLKDLRRAWLEMVDVDKLLNDLGRPSQPDSLLRGDYIYDTVRETLATLKQVDTPPCTLMDLFVTTTDLNGRDVDIQLSGAAVKEPVHREVFRFSRNDAAGCNDFAGNDPTLAFAARCTSSFPVAFPPMSLGLVPDAYRDEVRRKAMASTRQSVIEENRAFADGGYLDNRPFGHAIKLLPLRPNELPGRRVLFYVDPFPEGHTDSVGGTDAPPKPLREYNFIENAMLAATVLPRSETIREDLHAISLWNRQLYKLKELQRRQDQDEVKLGASLGEDYPARPPAPEGLEQMDLGDLVALPGYGASYATYHHLRVYEASDTLACLVGMLVGHDPDSDAVAFLRHIIRAWREARYSAYHSPGRETETAFLRRFDFAYQRRRLVHLLSTVNRQLEQGDDPQLRQVQRAVTEALNGLRARLHPRAGSTADFLPDGGDTDLRRALEAGFRSVMGGPNHDARFEAARALYQHDPDIKKRVDAGLDALGTSLRGKLDGWNAAIRERLDAVPEAARGELDRAFSGFHWHDVKTLPILDSTPPEEHFAVDVFRISPMDSSINRDPAKLCGIKLWAFGGFLSKEWRRHDLLWGRLDAAERIVHAMLHGEDEATKRPFVERLQEAILRDEFAGFPKDERSKALMIALQDDARLHEPQFSALVQRAFGLDAPPPNPAMFRDYYAELKPLGPPPEEATGYAARSARILSRMIDGLEPPVLVRGVAARAVAALRTLAALASFLVAISLPGSARRHVFEWLLLVLLASGVVLVILGAIFRDVPGHAGVVVVAATLLVWLLVYSIGRAIRHRERLTRALLLPAALVVLALAGLGLTEAVTWVGEMVDDMPNRWGACPPEAREAALLSCQPVPPG